jgi:copper ion binding protein
MSKTTLKISGMSCNHCKARVENALKGLDGVTDAVVNLSAAKADVDYDGSKVSPEKLAEAVQDAGYTVDK